MALPATGGCLNRETERTNPGGIQTSARDHYRDAKPAPKPEITAKTHYAAGQMLERQGNLQAAIGQFERAIVADPRYAPAYNRLAIVYQKLGQPAEAENMFKQGIRAAPGSAVLRNNLGFCLLAQRRFAEATEAFRDALTQQPDFERARMNLAIALAQSGRTDEALSEFSRVVPAETAHYNVALLAMHRGDYDVARHSLKLALEINPDFTEARDQLSLADRLAAGSQEEKPDISLDLPGPVAGADSAEAPQP